MGFLLNVLNIFVLTFAFNSVSKAQTPSITANGNSFGNYAGVSCQLGCNSMNAQNQSVINAGIGACKLVANQEGDDTPINTTNPDPGTCQKEVTCSPSGKPSKSSSNAESGGDDPTAYCGSQTDQKLTDSLDKAVTKEEQNMKADTKTLQDAQSGSVTSSQNETKTETELQQEITTAQQKLQQDIVNDQDQAQQDDQKFAQTLTDLQNKLNKLKTEGQRMETSERTQIISKYTETCNQALQVCTNQVRQAAQTGLPYANTNALASATQGGTVNSQCNTPNTAWGAAYLSTIQAAHDDMMQALQNLEANYQSNQADITSTTQQMANESMKAAQNKSTLESKAQLEVSQTTQNIATLNQNLMQAKQQFTQTQQLDQMKIQQAQQQSQKSNTEYQKDYATLQQLKTTGCGGSGCAVNPTDTAATQAADLKTKIDAWVAAAGNNQNCKAACATGAQDGAGNAPANAAGSTNTGTFYNMPGANQAPTSSILNNNNLLPPPITSTGQGGRTP